MPNNIQQDWLNHKELMLIRGVGKTPGDSTSAELDPVVVDLLSGLITLEPEDGWSPQIPPLKNGGVWTDSPINDGRQLLAAPNANVIETITVNIADAGYLNVNRALSSLNQMVADCRDYWQTETQIDPVYLRWLVSCGAGPQFALIYNIDIATVYLPGIVPSMRVTLKIEREPAWRPFPPGSNPKQWAYYINTAHPQWNVNGASLLTGSDHFFTQTINNKSEINPSSTAAPLTQNWIDIPGSTIPGDAPALAELSVVSDVENLQNLYISLSSKDLSQPSHDGTTHYGTYVLNAGDASVITAVKVNTGSNVTGVRSNGSAVNFFNVTRTVTGADANPVLFCSWSVDRQLLRGTHAIFCRCSNASAAPVLADMKIRMAFSENDGSNSNFLYTQFINPPITGATKNLVYMGTITIPFSSRGVVSALGYGTQIQNANTNLNIILQEQVLVATANRILEVVDLIFMPVDEALIAVIDGPTAGALAASETTVLDNSGYSSRGELQSVAYNILTRTDSGGVSQEIRGPDLTLRPKVDQRLSFIAESYSGLATSVSRLTQTFVVRLNIIPRWYGIRDV